eukprot:TRINITY_DN564_c0_g1_i1.p1 TRINITY_DN564_c0_g1~~TRINITY_DN564_c0_g1_i1.p1  ORF type:complete len:359 (-),score=79.41 TRINITY_DN564_c0_g1_i1:52-1128(-)
MKRKHESPKKSRNPLQMIQSRPEYQQHDIWFCILTQLAFSEPMQLQRCSRISSMFAATIERVKIAFVRDFIARYQKARDVNQLCDPDHEQRLIAAGFDVDTVYKEFLFPKLVQSDISFNDYRKVLPIKITFNEDIHRIETHGRMFVAPLPGEDFLGQTRDQTYPMGISKVGGYPHLPKGTDWPQYNGTDLFFLGQYNLSTKSLIASDYSGFLPTTGMLYMFISTDEGEGGAKVIHYDGEISNDHLERVVNTNVVPKPAYSIKEFSPACAEYVTTRDDEILEAKLLDAPDNEVYISEDHPWFEKFGSDELMREDYCKVTNLLTIGGYAYYGCWFGTLYLTYEDLKLRNWDAGFGNWEED